MIGVVLLSSCKNEQEKIMDKCEDAFVSKLNDPSSYELISISVIDTVRKSDRMEIEALTNKPYYEPTPVSSVYESLGDYYIEMKEKYTKDSLEYVSKTAKYDSIVTAMTNLKKDVNMDSITGYVVQIECRAKNAMGALVVGTSNVSYDVKSGECYVYKKD